MKKQLYLLLILLCPFIAFGQNLEVEGSVKIIDGTQGLDKVLTSDTSGLASWQSLPLIPPLDNVVWVATNGTPTGPGTIDRPFSAVQGGYDAAASTFPGIPSTVAIAGGGYGPLTMHAGTVHVIGFARAEISELIIPFGVPLPTGKQRVENVVVTGSTIILSNGVGAFVKFHNCHFLDGLVIEESFVEVQDCAIQRIGFLSPAVLVGSPGVPITEIGFYQSSMLAQDTSVMTGTLTLFQDVADFEVIGCSIVNRDGLTGPAVVDMTAGIPPGAPLHFFSHNVIIGPVSGTGFPAFADPGLPPVPSFSLVQNTIHGDVGSGVLPPAMAGRPQFFSNNTLYGLINYPAPAPGAPFGWAQAGVGPVPDAAGNIENPGAVAPFGPALLPSHWVD